MQTHKNVIEMQLCLDVDEVMNGRKTKFAFHLHTDLSIQSFILRATVLPCLFTVLTSDRPIQLQDTQTDT